MKTQNIRRIIIGCLVAGVLSVIALTPVLSQEVPEPNTAQVESVTVEEGPDAPDITPDTAAEPNSTAAEEQAEAPEQDAQAPSDEEPRMRPRRGFRDRGFRPDGGQRAPGAQEVAAADPNAPMEAINLNNIEMKQVIQKIAEWTEKPVIPVNDDMMKTRITIYSPKKVTRQEALELLILALQSRGIVVEELNNRIMLRPLAAMRLGSVPTLGPDEPLVRIEDKTQIVEKWFRLAHYSPTRLIQIITPLTAEYGYTVADEGTSQVAVIDTVENLMRIERLIRQLDLPEIEQQDEKIIKLNYADPAEVVQVLQLILGENSNARSSRQRGRSQPPQPSRPQPPQGGGEVRTATAVVVDAGSDTPVRLIPLVKQRSILVRGSREDIKLIEDWAQKLDMEEPEEMRQTVVQVRYADVREVVRMVNNTLQQMPGTDVRANIVVEALTQTGQIVIYGNETNRTMVERLIAKIDLPKEDFFEERTFKLEHADPDEIKKNIEDLYINDPAQQRYSRYSYYYGGGRSSGSTENTVRVISYPMLKQVTVIASPQNMEKIAQQIEAWDKPIDVERDQYRIFSLNNSDPVKLADLLKRLFTEETSASQSLWRILWGDEEAQSQQKIVGALYGMLTFEPVPDTKKLIVLSQVPEAYDVIERLINKLDARDEADVPRVITLKYADPEALCDQLNAILNEPGTPTTIPRSARGLSAYDTSQTNQAVTTSEEGSNNNITPWWTRQRMDNTQMPTSNLIGRVRFVPVHRSKAILVLAPPEYIADITQMIDVLDRPGMQVMIKAVIVEIGLSDMTSLGVKLASNPGAFGPLGVNAMTALNNLIYTEDRTNFASTTNADINVLVDLLIKHANGRVLNQPTLWTKDNEEAIFIKGQKVAFIKGDQTDSTGQGITRDYEFEDVGVTLRIRPNITPEKAVDLTINLNISQIEPELINDQNVRSNLDSTTRMIINDGQSVMMGGILTQKESFIQHKIPILGDLPLVGAAFRHEEADNANSELLIFVTPYVMDETALASIPASENGPEVHENARQRLDQTVEALNQVFMPAQPMLQEE